ncbi:MAG: hypothetical protein KF868_16660 [Acidobacteria bacterium]|nr:hypothetical protein [Acidobacteriota bacterium]
MLGLSLPVDIPWNRLCASEDMMVRNLDDALPRRWRSSLAVFGYEPPPEYQNDEDKIVSYMKVVVSLTGFQADPEEVGLRDRRAYLAWRDPAVIENYEETVTRYYGCYGAVLEVVVTPKGTPEQTAKIPLSQYPYFADFEPKKRELYELVSETGEVMSRSLENVSVHKGATTTDTREVVDIFGGASLEVTTPKGVGGGVGVQGQWGTRDINQGQVADIRTTEAGREARETFSHTTQLTQMYHQFNSYHLGTNRAVFYMLPRPHIVQAPNTFVNGPRVMEGIQEVFLVVVRPRAVEEICVEAYLETAHLGQEPIHEYETGVGSLQLHMRLAAPDQKDPLFSGQDDSLTIFAEDSETYTPPSGWEVDLERDGGYRITTDGGVGVVDRRVEAARDHVVAWGKIRAEFIDNTWPVPNQSIDGRLDLETTVFIRNRTPKVKGYTQTLWMTGRSVSTCAKAQAASGSSGVVWERPLKNITDKQIGATAQITIQEANQLRAEIGRFVLTSFNHPERYKLGTVKFIDTQFIASAIGRLVRQSGHPDNVPLASIKGLDASLRSRVAAAAAKLSRGRLLQMSLTEMSDRFGLTAAEAVKLRRAALGLEGAPPALKDRWSRPDVATPQKGPAAPARPSASRTRKR